MIKSASLWGKPYFKRSGNPYLDMCSCQLTIVRIWYKSLTYKINLPRDNHIPLLLHIPTPDRLTLGCCKWIACTYIASLTITWLFGWLCSLRSCPAFLAILLSVRNVLRWTCFLQHSWAVVSRYVAHWLSFCPLCSCHKHLADSWLLLSVFSPFMVWLNDRYQALTLWWGIPLIHLPPQAAIISFHEALQPARQLWQGSSPHIL